MSVDIRAVTYSLYAITPSDGSIIALPVSQLQFEEQTGELAVRLQATVPDVQTSAGPLTQLCALGGHLLLYANWGLGPTEIFRGTIFNWDWHDPGAPEFTLTAYDNLIDLQMSEDDRTYVSSLDPTSTLLHPLTAGDILQDISNAWSLGIQGCGQLTTLMPIMAFTGTKLSQMALELLDKTYWFGGGSWLLRSDQGVIAIKAPAQNSPIYVLTEDVLESFGDKHSIDNLVTRINVFGSVGDSGASLGTAESGGILHPRAPIAEQLDGHTEFGVKAAIYRANLLYGPDQVNALARATIGNRGQPQRIQTFSAPDLPFLRRGDAIAIHAGTLAGTYIITGISHDADRKQMQITVDTSGDLSAADANFTVHPSSASESSRGRPYPYHAPGSTS